MLKNIYLLLIIFLFFPLLYTSLKPALYFLTLSWKPIMLCINIFRSYKPVINTHIQFYLNIFKHVKCHSGTCFFRNECVFQRFWRFGLFIWFHEPLLTHLHLCEEKHSRRGCWENCDKYRQTERAGDGQHRWLLGMLG